MGHGRVPVHCHGTYGFFIFTVISLPEPTKELTIPVLLSLPNSDTIGFELGTLGRLPFRSDKVAKSPPIP
jgi:hypothetical protein